MTVRVEANRSAELALEAIIDDRLAGAMDEMAGRVREKISDPYPPASDPLNPPHRRSGGLEDAVMTARIGPMDHILGYGAVEPGPDGRDRSDLGIWMELGTGDHRHAPGGDQTIVPNPSGGATSVEPRPALLPTLLEDGPEILTRRLGG